MSSHSYLMAGVRLSDIFEVIPVEEEVTRYNEIDGSPYHKVIKHSRFYLFGKEIKEPEDMDPNDWKWEDLFAGLRVESSGYSCTDSSGKGWTKYRLDQYIVGLYIADVRSSEYRGDDGIARVDPYMVQGTLATVGKILKDKGYTKDPELFLICYSAF